MLRTWLSLLVVLCVLITAAPALAQEAEYALQPPAVALAGVPMQVAVTGPPEALPSLVLRAGGSRYEASIDGDTASFVDVTLQRGETELELLSAGTVVATTDVRVLPGWISLVPALIAIAVALAFKQVIPALFLGLWFGAAALAGFGPAGIFRGLLDTYAIYVLGAVTTPSQAQILLFSFMIGGMVGVVIKNGGMQGVVNVIVRFATDRRRGQLTTAALGVAVFFDDYTNTLVVGNTMRQVTDRLRISREKLAYIVDSTAAPVACVALVSTWIGYQVGLIGAAIAPIPAIQVSSYAIFLNSIAYSFYPFLTMFMVFTLAGLGRDFGPMHAAETRASTTGQVLGPDAKVDAAAAADAAELRLEEGRPVRAINAVVPLAALILMVIGGLYATGTGSSISDIIGTADSNMALMWASLMGTMVAVAMTIAQRILTLTEIVDAWYAGIKQMLFAMIILVLAWSLASVSGGLQTASYLVSVLGDWLSPGMVPSLVFVLAGVVAFSTGSSWATMGILMPLVVPLVWAVLTAAGAQDQMHILYSSVSCVLAGAVLGDHCSPISDTTILSSMASGCDHIEHVRTQLPYALVVGAVAIGMGTLPSGYGVPWWLGMLAGAATLYAIARYVGKPPAASVAG
ncbi:MAG TPA: Na+/H+ antiporter NhaC family protein [Acidobacteriota bacterium]|nr:Na+/H+ antiporter NhaC family protein [Acidobacteriota bacterium]